VLINEYSWDSVVNILKHEMAHQFVYEYLGNKMDLPHGPSFSDACEKLGLTYPFNTAAGDTPKVFTDMNKHDTDPDYNSKLNKVRKMLSLAGSGNKHEAAAAMSKANVFIRKYNLERLEKAEPATYCYEVKNTGRKRLSIIHRKVANLLMDYFFVDVVYSEEFDPKTAEDFHKTIELLGTRENVSFASHVYDFLMQRVEFLWHKYQKQMSCPGKLRRTFILGLLQGFREKLAREEKKQSSLEEKYDNSNSFNTLSGLVVAEDPGLSMFIAKRFPRLRKVQYGAPGIHCPSTLRLARQRAKR
jgi:hypothetical protein